MLMMDVILDARPAPGFDLWPTARIPAGRASVLSGNLAPAEVGTALAAWADRNHDDEDGEALASAPTTVDYLRRALAKEPSIAPGGLRLRHTGNGITLSPGCCCGLEDWREWLFLLDGDLPWTGHSPDPRMEHHGDTVRIWPDEDDATGVPLVLPLAELPGLLRSAQREMTAFLTLVERWAGHHAPGMGPVLRARLDADLHITKPLP
ncbi:hypothetical protein A6A08_03945 [Nocardiopsis sp. TSRI0078]|uniref:hypothetical protein n=1 Tax=unclassified Nocardiopsis TaxID=2649073 RepID=UPI000938F765|nr:hypothetical protein [Nocardiopsis sp. TSRI0078]OKI18788.1 hypothetical protein A6A08_03945 [Nocardiopsis sp. TSRI0078]